MSYLAAGWPSGLHGRKPDVLAVLVGMIEPPPHVGLPELTMA